MPRGAFRCALTAGLLAAVLSMVCSCAAGTATSPPAPTVASAPAPTAGASDDHGGGTEGGDDGGRRGRGGGNDGSADVGGGGNGRAPATVPLPADFPSDLPLPPGDLLATSGAAGQWSALLRVPGSAADALRSAMQFYVAAGFTQDSASTARRGPYAVTLVTENRDHSPTSTNLVVGVAAR